MPGQSQIYLPIEKLHFPSRNPGMLFLISRSIPGKRNFQQGIRTGNSSLLYSFEEEWQDVELDEMVLCLYGKIDLLLATIEIHY